MRAKTILAVSIVGPLLTASGAYANHEAEAPDLLRRLQADGQRAAVTRNAKTPKAAAGADKTHSARGEDDAGHSYRRAPDFHDYD